MLERLLAWTQWQKVSIRIETLTVSNAETDPTIKWKDLLILQTEICQRNRVFSKESCDNFQWRIFCGCTVTYCLLTTGNLNSKEGTWRFLDRGQFGSRHPLSQKLLLLEHCPHRSVSPPAPAKTLFQISCELCGGSVTFWVRIRIRTSAD